MASVLDEAIDELADLDRRAIVLRFYERRDLREVGLALGTTEDAAQKRVSRAVEKLRTVLMVRGVLLGVGVLASLLTSRVVLAAPAGLAARVDSNALAAAGKGKRSAANSLSQIAAACATFWSHAPLLLSSG